VRSQVLRQFANPGRQNGDLHLWRTGVAIRSLEIADRNLFSLFSEGHLQPQLLAAGPFARATVVSAREAPKLPRRLELVLLLNLFTKRN
jgi:hypothetical protein